MNSTALAPSPADLLCGSRRTSLVTAALELPTTAAVSVRVDRVQRRRDGVSVGYDVSYRAQGADVRDYLVASTAPLALAASGMARLSQDGVEVALWRHPADPALPGLATACDLASVTAWLPTARDLRIVTYRPLRRAVVQARLMGGASAYLKVVRPHVAAGLRQRHELLGHLGAPRVIAEPTPGLLVLSEVVGPTLGATLATAGAVPSLAAIEALLDAIPAEARELEPTMPWTHTVADQGRLVEMAPALRTRFASLTREVETAVRSTGQNLPLVATHGDLHAGNLILGAGGGIGGLLDVDRLGPGHRVDDLACLIGHTSLAGALDPTPAGAEAAARALAWWREASHPDALAPRIAALMLSLIPVLPATSVPAVLDQAEAWMTQPSH